MRILHLVHRAWPYHGGSERYVLEHAAAGVERGHSSLICTTDAWDMSWMVSRSGKRIQRERDIHRGVEILRFRVLHPPAQNFLRAVLRRLMRCGPDRMFYPNPFIPSLSRWLRRNGGFHMVHANAMPFMLHAGWRYCRMHGSGLISVPHANVGEKYRRLEALHYFRGCQERIFRDSSFVVAQSEFERGLFLESGVPAERIHLSGSGVDPDEFSNADEQAARRRLGVKGRIILSLTAHSLDRGFRQMLTAFGNVSDLYPDTTLVLAGPVMKDAEEFLNRHAEKMKNAHDRILLTGYVSRKERTDLLAASEMVLLPSRLDCFGIVVLESWLMGKPVIGCWSGGMPDMIRDGSNGYLVPFGDTATLTYRLRNLLDSPSLSAEMGARGRKRVLEHHTWKRITDDFYRRLAQCGCGEFPS